MLYASTTQGTLDGICAGAYPYFGIFTPRIRLYLLIEKSDKIFHFLFLFSLIQTDSFTLGQEFVWNYPESLDDLNGMQQSTDDQRAKTPQRSYHNDFKVTPCEGDSKSSVQESILRDKKHDNRSAIDNRPMGKLDLQDAVGISLNGPLNGLQAKPGIDRFCRDDVRVHPTHDSETYTHRMQSTTCNGSSILDSKLHAHYTKVDADINKESTSDRKDKDSHVRFSTSSDHTTKTTVSEKSGTAGTEKKKKRKKITGKHFMNANSLGINVTIELLPYFGKVAVTELLQE